MTGYQYLATIMIPDIREEQTTTWKIMIFMKGFTEVNTKNHFFKNRSVIKEHSLFIHCTAQITIVQKIPYK